MEPPPRLLARTVVVGGGVRCAVPCGDGALIVREAALEAIGPGPTPLWCEETGAILRSAAVLRGGLVALLSEGGHISLLSVANLLARPRLLSRLRALLPPPFREPHLLAAASNGSVLAIASYSSVSLSALKDDGSALLAPTVVSALGVRAFVWHISLSSTLLAILSSGPGPLSASTVLLASLNGASASQPLRSISVLWDPSAAPPYRVQVMPSGAVLVVHQSQVSIFGTDDKLAATVALSPNASSPSLEQAAEEENASLLFCSAAVSANSANECYLMTTSGLLFRCLITSSSLIASPAIASSLSASLVRAADTGGAGGILVALRSGDWLIARPHGDVLQLHAINLQHAGDLLLPWTPVMDAAAAEGEGALFVCTPLAVILLRHGISLARLSPPEPMDASALWSAHLGAQGLHLVLSFVKSTRVMAMKGHGSLEDASDASGALLRAATLYACAAHFATADGPLLCQVHSTGVLLLRPHNAPPLVASYASQVPIVAATGGRTALFVALADRRVLRLDARLHEAASIIMTDELSAMHECADGSLWIATYNASIYYYTWSSDGAATLAQRIAVPPPAAVPHSLYALPSSRILLGLRDGRALLLSLSLSDSNAAPSVILSRRLGHSPVSIVPLPDGALLLLSDSTAIARLHNDAFILNTLSCASAVAAAPLPLPDAPTALAVLLDGHLHVMLPDADAPRSAHAQRLYSISLPRNRFRRILPLSGSPPRLLIAARAPVGVEITLLDLTTNAPALPSVTLDAPGFAPSALAYFDNCVCVGMSGKSGGQLWVLQGSSLQSHASLVLPGRIGALHSTGEFLLVAVGPELRLYQHSGALTEVARIAHPSGLPLQSIAPSVSRVVLGTQRDGLAFIAYDEPRHRWRAVGADRTPHPTADGIALGEDEAMGVDKYGHVWVTAMRQDDIDVASDGARNLPSVCEFSTGEGGVRLLRARLSVAADLAYIAVGRLGALTAFVALSVEEARVLEPVVSAMRKIALTSGRAPLERAVLDGDALALFLRLTPLEQRNALYPADAPEAAAQRTTQIVAAVRQALQRVY